MNHITRTIFASSGPGVQDDVSPAGLLAMQFQHVHNARFNNIPTVFDELSGPVQIADGVRVTWAKNPRTNDQLPASVEWDSEKFSENDARRWLNEKWSGLAGEFTFEPDSQDKTPVTSGSRELPEKCPPEFSDLSDFYASTLPLN